MYLYIKQLPAGIKLSVVKTNNQTSLAGTIVKSAPDYMSSRPCHY